MSFGNNFEVINLLKFEFNFFDVATTKQCWIEYLLKWDAYIKYQSKWCYDVEYDENVLIVNDINDVKSIIRYVMECNKGFDLEKFYMHKVNDMNQFYN